MLSAVVVQPCIRRSSISVTSAAAASSCRAKVAAACASASSAARYAVNRSSSSLHTTECQRRHRHNSPLSNTLPAAKRGFSQSPLPSQDSPVPPVSWANSPTSNTPAPGIDIGSSSFFTNNQGPLFVSLLEYDDPQLCLHVLNDPRTAADVIKGADARQPSDAKAGRRRNYETPSRIDAYQHLHLHAPTLLADVTDDGLAALCIEAASVGLSEFVEQILNDLASTEKWDDRSLSATQLTDDVAHPAGVFNAPAGSSRRFHALQYLLSASTRGLNRSAAEYHAQTYEQAQMFTLNISTHALKGVSILLMKDLALIASRSLESISTLLSRVHPAVARWLMLVVVKNRDVTLVPLVNALWQRVEVASVAAKCDFPTPQEATHLCRYYLSLRSQPAEDAARILTPPSADAHNATGSPVSLAIASRIVDALLQAHPAMSVDGMLQACDDWGARLAKHVSRFDMSHSERTEMLMRLRVLSIMAFATSHASQFPSSSLWLTSIRNDLRLISGRFNDDIVNLFLITPVRFALRKACSTQEDARKADSLFTNFLPLIVDAAVQYRHSSDMMWLRDFCEKLIEWREVPRAIFIVFRTSDMVFDRGRLRSDIGYMLGGDNITAIASWLEKQRDYSTLMQLLKSVGLLEEEGFAVSGVAKSLLTPDNFARLITICAQSQLPTVAISFYNHVVDPQLGRVNDRANAHERLKTLMTPQVRFTTAITRNRNVSTDASAPVTQSSDCMVKLVDMVTALPRPDRQDIQEEEAPASKSTYFSEEFLRRQEDDVDDSAPLTYSERFAYKVLFTFMEAKPFAMWEYGDLINLAKALFRLGHKSDAFRCLADIPFRKEAYTSASFAVLVRGMAQTNLPKTIARLTEWCEMDYMQGRIDDSVLAPVVTEALISGQPYMALRVLELAQAQGLTEKSSVRSMALIVFTLLGPSEKREEMLKIAQRPTSAGLDDGFGQGSGEWDEFAQDPYPGQEDSWTVGSARLRAYLGEVNSTWQFVRRSIVKDGWHADPRLLRWITKKLAGASKAHRSRSEYAVASVYANAAAGLLQASGTEREWVSHSAAIAVLSTIRATAPPKTSKELFALHRERKINELDKIVSVLRWVRFYYVEGQLAHQDEARTLLLGDSTADMVDALTLRRESLAEKIDVSDVDKNASVDDRQSMTNGSSSTTPQANKLPLQTYRTMILAYLRLGDALGAASVMCWARDEAHITMRDLEHGFSSKDGRSWRKVLDQAATSIVSRGSLDHAGRTLSWLSGKEEVPRVKSWWEMPTWAEGSKRAGIYAHHDWHLMNREGEEEEKDASEE